MAKKDYSKKEAAELLKTTPAAIQKRIERGKIEAFKSDKGQWFVRLDVADIEAEKATKAKSGAKTKSVVKKKTATKPKAKAVAKTKKKVAAKSKPVTKPAAKKEAPKEETAKESVFSGESIQTVKPEFVQQYETDCMADYEKDLAATSSPTTNLVESVMDIATDARKRIEDTTNILMEKIEIHRDEARKVAEKIVEKGESQKNIYMFKLLESIESLRNKIVTRYDIERLESKIEALTKKLKK